MAKSNEPARYRLTQKAFLSGVRVRKGRDWIPYDDVLLDPEEMPLAQNLSGPFGGRGDAERVPLEIEYDGVPGHYMEPLNDAAHAMVQKHHRGARLNPIDALTIVGPGAKVLKEGDAMHG